MNTEFFLTFIGLSIINVVFSTIRSIVTIKSGKAVASLVSGGYFAFYNIMLLYTVAEFPMWQKCLITFVCNVIGVWFVKWAEEKARKDKLWKIEATFNKEYLDIIHKSVAIPHSYIDIGSHVIFNFYAENQRQSAIVKDIVNKYEKILLVKDIMGI